MENSEFIKFQWKWLAIDVKFDDVGTQFRGELQNMIKWSCKLKTIKFYFYPLKRLTSWRSGQQQSEMLITAGRLGIVVGE